MERMLFKDFIELEQDVDVYDDVTDDCGCCLCGPIHLTEEGKKQFGKLLDLCVSQWNDEAAVVEIDHLDNWEELEELLNDFLYAAAGYCSNSLYELWFDEEE